MSKVTSIGELSKSTLGSYIKKTSKTATGLATNAMHLHNAARMHDELAKDSGTCSAAQYHDDKSDEYYDHSAKATEKQVKRLKGVDKAVGKLTKESEDEQIDEISASTLHSYSAKAYNQTKRLGPGVFDTDDSAAAKKFIASKRQAGLSVARDKLSPTAKPTKDELHSKLKDLTAKFDPEYQQSDDHTYYTKHHDIASKIADTKRQINTVGQKTTSKETIKAKPSPSVLNKVIDIKKKLAEACLDESVYTSNSPSTNGSRGVKFDVVKNKEKSIGEHINGQAKEHFDVHHDGKHVGTITSYSGYKDTKPAGQRYVTSRKDVRLYSANLNAGEHNSTYPFSGKSIPGGHSETGFKSKNDALASFANFHKSNKNR